MAWIISAAFLSSACADSESKPPQPQPEAIVLLESSVAVPSSAAISIMQLEPQQEIAAGFLFAERNLVPQGQANDLVAVAAEVGALSFVDPSVIELESLRSEVASRLNATFSAVSVNETPDGLTASGEFRLVMGGLTSATPTEVVNECLRAILEVGGSPADAFDSELPIPLAIEISAREFRVSMTVTTDIDRMVTVVAAVPEAIVDDYAEIVGSAVDQSNIVDRGTPVASFTDSFIAPIANMNADFLFVIDNSGSMRDEQLALARAAADFSSEIQMTNLNIRVATITTDNPNPVGVGITSDLGLFTQDVVGIGTSGSSTETGIFFSEQALSFGGSLELMDFPALDASLSVIVLSDEPSQYTRRSSGVLFDPADNIFVDENYRVYSIVEPGQALSSQYDDLSSQTGGTTADIGDLSSFADIMMNIARNASGATSPFVLSRPAIASSIEVVVNGVIVENRSDGWQYFGTDNSIVLRGSAQPLPGDSIVVSYMSTTTN